MANKKIVKQHDKSRKRTALPLGSQLISSQQDIFNQAVNLHQAGKLKNAEILYKQVLKVNPKHSSALHYLGWLSHQMGKDDNALGLLLKSIRYEPDSVNALNDLGVVLKSLGRPDEAISSFQKAITLNPDFAMAHYNLGNALKAQKRIDEAVICYQQALKLKPDFIEAEHNLGNAFKEQGKLDEAIISYQKTLKLKPDLVNAHYNLGNTYMMLGQLDKAIARFRRTLDLKPDFVNAYISLGNAFKDKGLPGMAITNYRHALSLAPDLADVYNNLGNALQDQGKVGEAIKSYRQALKLNSDFLLAHSNLLMYLNYLPQQSIAVYLEEARQYGRKAKDKVGNRFTEWSCSLEPDRLCLGIVSSDLRNHPVGYFLENMLVNTDQSKIDLIAYPTRSREDGLTHRIRPYFSAWKSLVEKDDETAARLIHDDGVHILLDLTGHTGNNRLPVFSWKPAPIQATWLGYCASTGIEEMDYLIADPISVPESLQEQFVEKVWYLPETRFCFTPPLNNEEISVSPLPALHNGYITFGCFQNLSKINEEVLATWGRIFQKLPKARLRLQDRLFNSDAMRDQVLLKLSDHGIEPEQVILKKRVPRKDYLEAHAQIDIILDTFPFTGGTTTCEALWLGIPTLTLVGETLIARQGASILTCAGIPDWVAKDEEEYVAKAIAFASDLDKLAKLRAGLRQQVLASPLFDGPMFARNFETAMWGMWDRYRAEHYSNEES